MKPGRELDALIAEKVMGLTEAVKDFREYNKFREVAKKPGGRLSAANLKACGLRLKYSTNYMLDEDEMFFPNYSTDIAAAWEVVEKITGDSPGMIHFSLYAIENRCFEAFFRRAMGMGDSDLLGSGLSNQENASAPHAICLAALQAVGYEDEMKQD